MTRIEDLLLEVHDAWEDGARLAVLGRELQTRSRLDAARRVLERAVALDPQNVDAWANLSYAAYRSLDAAGGADALRRGIEATNSDSLRSILASFTEDEEAAQALRAGIAGTEDRAAQAGLLSQRFWAGERDAALEGLRAMRGAHPDDEDVEETFLWVLVGAANRGVPVDLMGEALPLARHLVAARPDSMGPRWMLLMLFHAAKDWRALLDATEEALGLFPDEETVMQYRARAYRELGDLDRAARWYHRAIGAKPSFVGARVELGRLHEQQGRLDLAEETFREIPRANPGYATGPMSLALFLARQGQLEEAEDLFVRTWPGLPAFVKPGLLSHTDAKPLLEREAVRKVLET